MTHCTNHAAHNASSRSDVAGLPLCHVFRADDRVYAYDTSTSNVLEIDDLIADLLASWTGVNDAEVKKKLSDRHGAARVDSALGEIRDARKAHGLFAATQIESFAFCPSCFDEHKHETEVGHLSLAVTEQCNLRCKYCPYTNDAEWIRNHANVFMSEDVALRAVDYFLARSHEAEERVISFYGGEPLLAFNLIQTCVEHVRSREATSDITFKVDTNATLINQEMAKFLAEEEFLVQISLDGPRQVHDRHRVHQQGAGSYDDVVRAVNMLIDQDLSVVERILFMATAAPPFELPAVIDFFEAFPPYRSRGIERSPMVRLNVANLEGIDVAGLGVGPNWIAPLREQLSSLRMRYLDALTGDDPSDMNPAISALFDQNLIGFYHRDVGPLPQKLSPGGYCQPGVRRLHVRANGEFQPCEKLAESMVIGNVNDGTDVGAIRELMDAIADESSRQCEGCWAARICDVCFTSLTDVAGNEVGNPGRIPEELCAVKRAEKEQTLQLVAALMNEQNGVPESIRISKYG